MVAPDPRRELNRISLSLLSDGDYKPDGPLTMFSLTEPDRRPGVPVHPDHPDLSLVWATGVGET